VGISSIGGLGVDGSDVVVLGVEDSELVLTVGELVSLDRISGVEDEVTNVVALGLGDGVHVLVGDGVGTNGQQLPPTLASFDGDEVEVEVAEDTVTEDAPVGGGNGELVGAIDANGDGDTITGLGDDNGVAEVETVGLGVTVADGEDVTVEVGVEDGVEVGVLVDVGVHVGVLVATNSGHIPCGGSNKSSG
jgi:hypothetical protein